MLYCNGMIPHHASSLHTSFPKKVKKKKKKVKSTCSTRRRRKKFSIAYYFKHVLWKALWRFLRRKKRSQKKRRKKSAKNPILSTAYKKRNSEQLDERDFWGSKYGSEWLFSKQHCGIDQSSLVEIVDAFKSCDLKYSKRSDCSNARRCNNRAIAHSVPNVSVHNSHHNSRSSSHQSKDKCYKCKQMPPGRKTRVPSANSESDWSLSTFQFDLQSCSRWPPSQHIKNEPLSSVISRLHAYVDNWMYVDQLQCVRKAYEFVQIQDLKRSRNSSVKKLKLKEDGVKHLTYSQESHHLNLSDTASSYSHCSSLRHVMKSVRKFDHYRKKRRLKKAKERASVLWLLSKAFNGNIPEDLRNPFYRDHDNQRRLKPKIVHSLANAELYCLSLVNIYADPNYHNLNHHGIIQALMRKGICLVESKDAPLTETVLVQTAPIRMAAHMSVIEGVMSLYIKEVLIPEKVVEAVRGFAHVNINSEMPTNPEEAAVLWINRCCTTLECELRKEWKANNKSIEKLPRIPVLQEISDISDGCSLAAVLSFYCPEYFTWQDVCWNDPMSIGDSIYNLQLVKKFCRSHLPYQIDFLSLEDFLYVHPTIKDNILAFVADLLYLFVIWPVSCVKQHRVNDYEETSQIKLENYKSSQKVHQVVSCSQIPNLRSDSYGGSTSSLPEVKTGHRSGVYKESLERQIYGRKSSLSNDCSETLCQLQRTNSAGIVNGSKASLSSLDDSGDTNSRYNNASVKRRDSGIAEKSSSSVPSEKYEPSQKSFSSDIRMRRPDSKDTHSDFEKVGMSETSQTSSERLSSGLENYYSQLASGDASININSSSNLRDMKYLRSSNGDTQNVKYRDSSSSQSSGICVSDIDNKNLPTTSFAQLSKLRDANSNAINIVYMQHDREGGDSDKNLAKSSFLKKVKQKEKKATFATLPNTTTWQQQRAASSNSPQADSGHETPTDSIDPALNVQLANIRMKLEEKRRKIELEKKRMEALWKRRRQKLGKAAFLQAINKNNNTEANTPDSGTGKDVGESELTVIKESPNAICSPSLVRRMSVQEIAEDLNSVQKKWLEVPDTPEPFVVAKESDIDAADVDVLNVNDLQSSIEQFNTSLNDLQADISRITFQQEHIENLMQDSVEEASHFFLHNLPAEKSEPESLPIHLGTYRDHMPGKFQNELNGHLSPMPLSPQRRLAHQDIINQQKHATRRQDVYNMSQGEHDYVINTEELYSKVVKPNKQKMSASSQPQSLPFQRNAQHNTQEVQCSRISDNRFSVAHMQNFTKPSQECQPYSSHTTGASSPKHGASMAQRENETHNFHRKKLSMENDQGFYIPFDDFGKKSKPKSKRTALKNDQITVITDAVNNRVYNPSKKDVSKEEVNSFGFVIGADFVHPDPETEVEMARKKEMIMTMSIKRRIEHENKRAAKEQEYARLREEEQQKREYQEKKREEEKRRRQAILEQYRLKKLQEELEKESGNSTHSGGSSNAASSKPQSVSTAKSRNKSNKPRPKSAYVGDTGVCSVDNIINKRSSQLITTGKEASEFDVDSLNSTSTASSRDVVHSPSRTYISNSHTSPSQRSGDATLRVPEGSGPSSDGASDTTSNSSSAVAPEYTGPKLFVKPTAKSNRGIIINAINTVLAGAVNADTKKKVLEEINTSESKHFLILFRDAGCQFRAIYSYNPEREEVIKLYGIGPKSITDKMMERFYKYNSGGKCFSEIQTKHLTVTIDAFTIPNTLWAGKKAFPPRKEFL